MKIQLLGTGGADGVPGYCSGSRVSEYARRHGGKDVRMRAAAIVDDGLKIDLGPDTHAQCTRFGLDPRDWSGILFTHSDADHFAPDELMYFLYPFNDQDHVDFTIFANPFICERIETKYPDWPFELVRTKSFEPFRFDGYEITPIHAHHKQDEDAHNFIIESNGKTLAYCTDTGIWDEPTWDALQDHSIHCLVLECTEGFAHTDYDGHLDAREFKTVLERLHKIGAVCSNTTVITTHHSHNGEATHAELEAYFNPLGVTVGFDGLIAHF